MSRVICLLVESLALLEVAGATSIVRENRIPPIGWEKKIAKGFDPPIEYVVVYGTDWYDLGLKMESCAAKWGPRAVPALISLYKDPDWSDFKDTILQFIGLYTTKDAADFFAAEISALRAQANLQAKDRDRLPQLLWSLRKADAKCADDGLEVGLKDTASPCFETFVYELMRLAQGPYNSVMKSRLEQVRQALPADSVLRGRIVQAQESNKAYERAQDPMDIVLKRENAGKR